MGSSHSVPKEGGERLSDYLQREFKGKGFNADTLVVVALKEEQKQQQKDKKKRKGLWKQITGRLSKRSGDKQDRNTKGNPTKLISAESSSKSATNTPPNKAEKEDNVILSNNANIVDSSSPEKKCLDVNNDTEANQCESIKTQNVDPQQSTSNGVERRYLRNVNSPVYQFKVPLKYDLKTTNYEIRDVRDMTGGTLPRWANKDYGSEPWEDDSEEKNEEASQVPGSRADEMSRSIHQQVGGWSDETAYRVRGIVQELSNLACMLAADATTHDITASSIVDNAQKAARTVTKKAADPATQEKVNAPEAFDKNKVDIQASSNQERPHEAAHSSGNKTKDTARCVKGMALDASCQTETAGDEELNNVGGQEDNEAYVNDVNAQENANCVKNMVVDNVDVVSETVQSFAKHNDKAMAYIAGILAAGAAYSIGNRTDVQRAAYFAGVRAVDAAYRMANETANSFAEIRVVDSTKSLKKDIEVETAAYLAGIRAVEDVHRKAEETAYMNGIKDAKEAIHSTGNVNKISFEKRNTMDTSFCCGENLEQAPTITQTSTEIIEKENFAKPLKTKMSHKDLNNIDKNNIVNKPTHGNNFTNRKRIKEVTSKKITTDANSCIGHKEFERKSSDMISDNTEDVDVSFDQSFQEDTDVKSNVIIKEADIQQKAAATTDKHNTGSPFGIERCNIPKISVEEVNKNISSDNHLLKACKVDNCHGGIFPTSGFKDSNIDDAQQLKTTSTTVTEPNSTDECLHDREGLFEEKQEYGGKDEVLFMPFGPSTIHEKQNGSSENSILNGIKTPKTKEASENKVNQLLSVAAFDEMPINKVDTLLKPSGKKTDNVLEGLCDTVEKAKMEVDRTSEDKAFNGKILSDQQCDTKGNQQNIEKPKGTETVQDTFIKNNQEKVILNNQSNAAFFVSLDTKPTNTSDIQCDVKENIRCTPNIQAKPFIDMATFDEMPIKKAEALLRPPGEETEFASPGQKSKTKANNFKKKKPNKQIKPCTSSTTENNQESIGTAGNNENRVEVTNPDKCENNNFEKSDRQTKTGAAEAFFVSFHSPTIENKGLKKEAKKDSLSVSKQTDKHFIDMATFDDMPIKKADALLRPFGKEEEYKSEANRNKETVDMTAKSDVVKTKVKRLVRKTAQYGSVEHNNLIQGDNAERKEKIESATTKVDSWKTTDDDKSETKPIKRPPKLFAKKAQYGSVAHNNEIKEGNELRKKKIESITSSLDTWKAKETEVTKKSAQYGSVEHNNKIKMDNAMRKKRLGKIHSNLDTWNAPNPGSKYSLKRQNEWEPVRDPGKYGSIAHFHQIKSDNAKRKQRMSKVHSSLDTWNKPNPGSMYSLKRKDEWKPVSDTSKYGSVAHFHQIKQKNVNNKQMIQAASSKLCTWQSKSKMNAINHKSIGTNNYNTHNKAYVNNANNYTERNKSSPRQNDHKIPSWSRYVSSTKAGEYDYDQNYLSYNYPNERTYQNFDAYNSPHRQHRNKNINELSFEVTGVDRQHHVQRKIPELIIQDNGDSFATGRSKAYKSSFDSEYHQNSRYREVNPLTVEEPTRHSLAGDYLHSRLQESARSFKSSFNSECHQTSRYREVNPLTVEEPTRHSLAGDYLHSRLQESARSFKSSFNSECHQTSRYREVNPLTVEEPPNHSLGRDYLHSRLQETSRSWSRPVSYITNRGKRSLIPIAKENPIRKYEDMLEGLVHRSNELKTQSLTRWSPRGHD